MRNFATQVARRLISALWWVSRRTGHMAGTLNKKQFLSLDFEPQADDIFVVTYPRSGTTLMQQLLYQLKTEGSMEFTHISAVVPFFDRLATNRYRRLKVLPQPRIFKSHYAYADLPQGPGKYIYVMRDGMDVAVSYYHFYRSHLGVNWSFAEFFANFMRGRVQYGSWFEHVAGWWCHRNDTNVLFLRYEDLVADMPQMLDRIAGFCGVPVAPERRQAILESCSFAFMKAHESKFDHLTELWWEQGLAQGEFIRKGRIGDEHSLFSERQRTDYERELANWSLPQGAAPGRGEVATSTEVGSERRTPRTVVTGA